MSLTASRHSALEAGAEIQSALVPPAGGSAAAFEENLDVSCRYVSVNRLFRIGADGGVCFSRGRETDQAPRAGRVRRRAEGDQLRFRPEDVLGSPDAYLRPLAFLAAHPCP